MFENEDQNMAIIDSGCPEPCVGKPFIDQLEESTGKSFETSNMDISKKPSKIIY